MRAAEAWVASVWAAAATGGLGIGSGRVAEGRGSGSMGGQCVGRRWLCRTDAPARSRLFPRSERGNGLVRSAPSKIEAVVNDEREGGGTVWEWHGVGRGRIGNRERLP